MEKKLKELVNRRPNKWGNVTIKEFERDIKMLQDAVKERGRERDYAVLYLNEKIGTLEYRLKHTHLLPHMKDSIELELAVLKTDLACMKHSAEVTA